MIWENMAEKINGFDDIKNGSKISGEFEVSSFKDKLQLKIKNADSIKIE